jgi:hypothetical protein
MLASALEKDAATRFSFTAAFYAELHPYCLEHLKRAFNQRTQLFDQRLHNRVWGLVNGTENSSSTAMVLIALSRAGIDTTSELPLDVPRVLDALTALHRSEVYRETLGLLAWANAVWDGIALPDLLGSLGLSLRQLPSLTAPFKSSELAWLVSGLAHEHNRSGDPAVLATLQSLLKLLETRQHQRTHLFYHGTASAPLQMRWRRHVGTFADQIYGIQAFSFATLALNNATYRRRADACAAQITGLQGPLGQWWWHYDARTGRVLQAYPVYSVHQHGMAPMGLMALAAAGGGVHVEAIRQSHAWQDRNELGAAMTDRQARTMWRDIEVDEGSLARSQRKLRSVLGMAQEGAGQKARLTIRYDTWPYEWAWCLYAAAIVGSTAPALHLI